MITYLTSLTAESYEANIIETSLGPLENVHHLRGNITVKDEESRIVYQKRVNDFLSLFCSGAFYKGGERGFGSEHEYHNPLKTLLIEFSQILQISD